MPVKNQTMLGQFETEPQRDRLLPPLDFLIAEFLDPPAFQTHDMIVVLALIQFKNRMAAFKMMASDQSRRFELGQYPINGRQPDLLAGIDQRSIDRLGGHVRAVLLLQHVEDLHPRQGDFQPCLFEFFRAHVARSGGCACPRVAVVRYDVAQSTKQPGPCLPCLSYSYAPPVSYCWF